MALFTMETGGQYILLLWQFEGKGSCDADIDCYESIYRAEPETEGTFIIGPPI